MQRLRTRQGQGSTQGCPDRNHPDTRDSLVFISGSERSLKSHLLPLGWRGRLLEMMPGSVQGGWAWLYPTERTARSDGRKWPYPQDHGSRVKTKTHGFYHYNPHQDQTFLKSGCLLSRQKSLLNQGTQWLGHRQNLRINYFNSG